MNHNYSLDQIKSKRPKLVDIKEYDCQICHSLPQHPIKYYQCKNSHLICDRCYENVNFDKKCGLCRIDMNLSNVSRNRIAELAVKNIIVNCTVKGCKEQIYYGNMSQHLDCDCQFVITECKYQLFGCQWKGIRGDQLKHQSICKHQIDLDVIYEKYIQTINKLTQTTTAERELRLKNTQLEALMINNFCNYSFSLHYADTYSKQNDNGQLFEHSFKMASSTLTVHSQIWLKFMKRDNKMQLLCKNEICCITDVIDDCISIGIIFENDLETSSTILSMQKSANVNDTFLKLDEEWNLLYEWERDIFEEFNTAEYDLCNVAVYIGF